MNLPISLSLEEELQFRTFFDLAQRMSREQARDFLIETRRQMIMKEKMYQHFIKQEWSLD